VVEPFGATAAGQQIPDIVANLRVDQPWGSAQLSGAAHQLRTSLWPGAGAICGVSTAGLIGIAGLGGVNCNAVAGTGAAAFSFAGPALTGYANPTATQNDWGFAVQGGVKINMPWIAPGDVFYAQATYERGALGYILGNTLAFTGGFWASSLNYGDGLAATPSSNNWGYCDLPGLRVDAQQQVLAATGAERSWRPLSTTGCRPGVRPSTARSWRSATTWTSTLPR
jgi:hypothetical protein